MPVPLSDQPLISVVIPAYNRAAAIGGCLRSICEQSYQNWEAIVVDDGSTDGTASAVIQTGREDDRIRLERHERNRGAQAARNTGIRHARGEWIAFLDSDDQFLPHSLESRLKLASKENVSVVDSACDVISEDGVVRPYRVTPLTGWIYPILLEREGPMFQSLLVSKRALERIGYLDERIVAFQEWDTSIRLAKHYKFGFDPRPTFLYDCRNSDTISKQFIRAGRGYEQVIHKHYRAILRCAGARAMSEHYTVAASWYERGGDQKATNRCQWMSSIWRAIDDPARAVRKLARLLKIGTS